MCPKIFYFMTARIKESDMKPWFSERFQTPFDEPLTTISSDDVGFRVTLVTTSTSHFPRPLPQKRKLIVDEFVGRSLSKMSF